MCIILEANHLLTLRQQNHRRRFFFLLQFLVFLSEGPVDPHRRHLGFKINCYVRMIEEKNRTNVKPVGLIIYTDLSEQKCSSKS